MVCPNCGSKNINVTNSRKVDKERIVRRKICLSCGEVFHTTETIDKNILLVVKKDGSKEPFDKQKAALSILAASQNTDLTYTEVLEIIDQIYKKHNSGPAPEITTETIKNEILERLLKINKLIYFNYRVAIKPLSSFKELKNIIYELSES